MKSQESINYAPIVGISSHKIDKWIKYADISNPPIYNRKQQFHLYKLKVGMSLYFYNCTGREVLVDKARKSAIRANWIRGIEHFMWHYHEKERTLEIGRIR